MQTSSDSSEVALLPQKLTSYWYSQHPAAFLMHIKDIITRIDQDDPQNVELKKHIRTYIRQVEKLENGLLDVSQEKLKVNQQEVKLLEQKLADVNKQIDELTAKLIEKKISLISTLEENAQLDHAILKYMQTIYNPLIKSINKVISGESGKNQLKNVKSLQRLQCFQMTESGNALGAFKILADNRIVIDSTVQFLIDKSQGLNKIKAFTCEQILNFFEKREDVLFRNVNRRYEATNKTLENIAESQRLAVELDVKNKELKDVQDRKLANIILYRSAIAAKAKPDSNKLDNSTEGSEEAEAQKAPSPVRITNPQIVFQQEQAKPIYRVLLVVWFIILASIALII